MQNLEQIRARNAMAFSKQGAVAGKQGGDVIKKVPSHILNHGLLASTAYSFTENNDGWRVTFDAIAKHLADPDIGIVPADEVKDRNSLMGFLTAKGTSGEVLKMATVETMAWLQYARRFVSKKDTTQ